MKPNITDEIDSDLSGFCVLCGKQIPRSWIGTGNPWPISRKGGRCCDDCTANRVIPARLKLLIKRRLTKVQKAKLQNEKH